MLGRGHGLWVHYEMWASKGTAQTFADWHGVARLCPPAARRSMERLMVGKIARCDACRRVSASLFCRRCDVVHVNLATVPGFGADAESPGARGGPATCAG